MLPGSFWVSGKRINPPENLAVFERKGVILKDILPGKGIIYPHFFREIR